MRINVQVMRAGDVLRSGLFMCLQGLIHVTARGYAQFRVLSFKISSSMRSEHADESGEKREYNDSQDGELGTHGRLLVRVCGMRAG